MTASSAPDERDGPDASDDTEYARAYAQGYGDGVRSALREVVAHVTRGHTTAELRMLIESRLARLSEEVEAKRRSLLAPPERPAWGALLRSAPVRPWSAPTGAPPAPSVRPGQSFLVREDRPRRAVEIVRRSAAGFARTMIVSLHPPAFDGLAPSARVEVPLAPAGPAQSAPSLSEISGRITERLANAEGPVLLYVDALEYFLAYESPDTVLRFVAWLLEETRRRGGGLVVSADPQAFDPREIGRLQRLFPSVL